MINTHEITVDSALEFTQALSQHKGEGLALKINGVIADMQSVELPVGVTLEGVDGAELHFRPGQPGLMLSANNRVSNLRIVTDPTLIALGLSDTQEDLGRLEIRNLRTVGRVHLEASGAMLADIFLSALHVETADATIAAHRPAGFGVEVLLGAITVYNFSKSTSSKWTLSADNLSCGSANAPVMGSGVFVFGGDYVPVDANLTTAPAPTQAGGLIEVLSLETGEVHSNGNIPPGTSNLITGGVFLGSGVNAKKVVNHGLVATYGANDMVLDNWGNCDTWLADQKIVSYGASGIGFVNFGDIDQLKITGEIETHGMGARGFNLYDGKLKSAIFSSITTFGDGAIGIQISKPFGDITVLKDIRTKGGEGDSLVRGKIVHLKAHALSLKPGAEGQSIEVLGDVVSENPNIPPFDFSAPISVVKNVTIAGKTLVS